MSSTPVRQPEVNAIGVVGVPCSSAAEIPSPQQQASTPTLNNLLRGDAAATAMYIQQQQQQQQQQSMQQLQIRPPHMSLMMGPPQGGFQSPQPSPIPNGSYSSPGSAGPPGNKAKGKSGSRPASRDVVFPSSAGQGGPPPQMHPMQNPAVLGLRMDGAPASPAGSPGHGFSCADVAQAQHAAAVAAQQQVSQQQLAAMQQQHTGYPTGMYPPGYWPPQQPRYPMQPAAAPAAHYYHHPAQPQVPHSGYSGYSMAPSRAMMPTAKMPQATQMEMPRLPNGPSAADWQAKINATKVPSQECVMAQVASAVSTSSGNVSVSAPSPGGASSAADESLDDSKSIRGGSPASWPHTPAQLSQGQRTPVPSGQQPTSGIMNSAKLKESSIVDKLVGPVTSQNPQHVMGERRAFFEKLVLFCERQGEPITQVPQVSKQTVDLHRLYIAVMKRGGFEQVTREKTWKHVCTEANSEMSESSAAGYQLRRHYQKYLLGLECFETGKSASEAVAFAEKLKKRRRTDKDHHHAQQQYPGPGPPGQAPGAPPGYGPHPGDPNAAYYYGHQMDPTSMQARTHGWPPQGYPPAAGVGGAPPGYPPAMRSTAPMRTAMPQQMMQGPSLEEQQRYEEQQRQHYYQQQQQQQVAYASQQQIPSTMPPSSSSQVDPSSSQSRAPSAGPAAGSATPDSSSRLSAEDTMSHCPSSHSQTSAPASSSAPPPGSQPPPVGYYGQTQTPQMYGSPGLRPGVGAGTASMQMKPTAAYPGAYSQSQPTGYPSVPGYPDGYQPAHPAMAQQQQQHQLYQQQMWASQQAQRYPPGGAANVASSSATPPMNAPMGPRGSVGMPSSADVNASQQAYPAARRPPYYHMQAQTPTTGSPSPGAVSAQRLRYAAPPAASSSPLSQSQPPYGSQSSVPPQLQGAARPLPIGAPVGYPHLAPSTSTGLGGGMHASANAVQSTSGSGVTGPHHAHGGGIAIPAVNQYPPPQPLQFPAGSVEATTISQRRRRKLLSKDLIRADPRRLTMALRSGLETETTWALNALNALLYDDMAVPLNLNHSPALLNVIVEHFRAQLAILFPKIFKVGRESKVRTVDEEGDFWASMLTKGEKTQMQQLVTPRSAAKNEPNNFTRISRTGRTVHIEKKEFPDHVIRMRPDGWSLDPYDDTLSVDYFAGRVPRGMGSGTSTYLACRLVDNIETKKKLKAAQFFLHEPDANATSSTKAEVDEVVDYDSIDKSSRVIGDDAKEDCDSRVAELTVEMRSLRPTALCMRDEARMSIVKRCLSISNILRGFSFLPGNEAPMSRHAGLLYIVGRLLRLYADERPITRPKALGVKLEFNKDETLPVPAVGTLSEATRRLLAPGELLESDDDDTLMLLETATQLREDAFVIVSHLSVQMELLDFDSDVSWPVFDGLIHWCVSKVAEAKDPLQPGYISPRNYALETLCKMSVIERNVDLLISTGPWSRIERFIHVLADLLSINEEVPCREFAIVILNAVCAASEQACYVTAAESPAVNHLVSFLEMGDSNMHQVVQQHGMQALRENPEMMGTSVGMLRRAASLLQHLCRVSACRKYFIKHQQRLLQFTMSQLMDSRVGAIIADVLYEVQKGIAAEMEERQLKKEAMEVDADPNQEPISSSRSILKEELDSGDEEPSEKPTKEEQGKEQGSRKRSRDENGISEGDVSENIEDDELEDKEANCKDVLSRAIKRQRLENGTLNCLHKNGGSSAALVNGDVSTRSPSTESNVIDILSPNTLTNRKNTSVAVENGAPATTASAGSVQAVA